MGLVMVQYMNSRQYGEEPTAQSKNFIQTRRQKNKKHAQKPTERGQGY